jgi:hypothetical protein
MSDRSPNPATSAKEVSVIAPLYGLSPTDFERLVALLLHASGFVDVQLLGGPNDRGVDITCRDSDGGLIAVQCKRYDPARRVGALAIQHLSAMAFQRRAHRGIFVTTASFTVSAQKQAEEFDIELVDGERLIEWARANPNAMHFINANWIHATPKTTDSQFLGRPVRIPYEVWHNYRDLPAFLGRYSANQPATVNRGRVNLTEAQRRNVNDAIEYFTRVTPYQFRQAIALNIFFHRTGRTRVGQTKLRSVKVHLLENSDESIYDFVLEAETDDRRVLREFVRCHQVAPDAVLSAQDIYEFAHRSAAYRPNWGKSYCTNGYFSCGAYTYAAQLKTITWLLAMTDGVKLAGEFSNSIEQFSSFATQQTLPAGVESGSPSTFDDRVRRSFRDRLFNRKK